VRGIGELPTTEARSLLGCIGFMNAAFGVRFLPEDFRRLFRPPFFAAFLDDFLAEDFRDEDFFLPLLFFFAAILSPGLVIGCELLQRVKRRPSGEQTIAP